MCNGARVESPRDSFLNAPSPTLVNVYDIKLGDSPVVVSFPHSGTALPRGLCGRLSKTALELPDTDWLVPELYDFLLDDEVTTITANYSRYLVDLNRYPDDRALYPGHKASGVCPTTMFSGENIYRSGCEPTDEECSKRIERYWMPYHDALSKLVSSTKRRHGVAIVYDAHSIAPVVPTLFQGTLPALNVGTANGSSCSSRYEHLIAQMISSSRFSYELNGRFKGGYITQHYGRPEENSHSIQMELSQANYLDASRHAINEKRAMPIRRLLWQVVSLLLDSNILTPTT